MPKRPLRIPDRSEITDETPLHLETAARLSFPDASVSALALRNAAARGELEHVQIGGRILTTLAWVKDFMELCRRPAHARKAQTRPLSKDEAASAAVANAYRVLDELRSKKKPR